MKKMKGYRKVTVLGNTYYWKLNGCVDIVSFINNKKKYYHFSMERVDNINSDITEDSDCDYGCYDFNYTYSITPSKICSVICLYILNKSRKETESILSSKKEKEQVRISPVKRKTITDYKKEYDYYLKNDLNSDNIQYGLLFHYWELQDNIPVKKEKIINCFSNPKFVKEICSILNGNCLHRFELKSFKKHIMGDYNHFSLEKEVLDKMKNREDFKEYFSTKIV